jgi:hypothetical protein
MAKSLEMMVYGRVLYSPLIIDSLWTLVTRLNSLEPVPNVEKKQKIIGTARNQSVINWFFYVNLVMGLTQRNLAIMFASSSTTANS